MWLIVAIEIGVPLFLMGMVACVPQPNKVLFSLFAIAMGLAVFFCWLVFPWHISSQVFCPSPGGLTRRTPRNTEPT